MSHTTKRKSQLTNVDLIKKAVARIPGAKYKGMGTAKQFSTSSNGIIVELPGYNYPVAINTRTGEIASDTYNGRWGDPKLMDQLAQGYGIEAAKAEADRRHAQFEEIPLEDGSIKCRIVIGGSADTGGVGQALGGTSAPTL